MAEARATVAVDAARVARALGDHVARRLSLLEGLYAFAGAHPEGEDISAEFEAFATGLRGAASGIRSIQYFPASGPALSYPVEIGESAVGNTLAGLLATDRGADAARAIEGRMVALAGPHELRQGGLGLEARKPLFDGERLRGLVAIAFDVPPLVEEFGQWAVGTGIELSLLDASGRFFFGAAGIVDGDPVTETIGLPEGQWILCAAPEGGWAGRIAKPIAAYWVVAAAFGGSIAFIVYLLSSREAHLREVIRLRTAEITGLLKRFERAMESIPDSIAIFDRDLRVKYMNGASRAIAGRDPSLLSGLRCDEALPPSVSSVCLPILRGALEGRETRSAEAEIRLAEGEPRFLSFACIPLTEEDGTVVEVLGVARDLTERTRAQERLREREARYRGLFEANPNPMWVYDLETLRFLDVNDAAVARYGYGEDEFMAMTIADIRPAEDVPALLDNVSKVVDGGFDDAGLWRHKKKDGSVIDVRIMSHELDYAGRRAELVSAVDVTDQLRVEAGMLALNAELEGRVQERTRRLERANADLESFAFSVAHDLRAPLRSIDGFARIVEEEYMNCLGGEGAKLLGVVRDNARKLDALVTGLLALARAGRAQPWKEPLDMRALALSAFEEAALGEDLAGIEFSVGDIPPCRGDGNLMRQVWVNLLSNAVKYTRGGKIRRIGVSARRTPSAVRYVVEDSGLGFDQACADRLFSPFQRLNPPGRFEGTGIGLSIVRRIVEGHGGEVGAVGRPGEGATFWFSLPGCE